MRNNNTLSRAILASVLCGPGAVMAGGFSLNEQSASAMGVANAGTAANPENATTVFFNPAGMSQLSGTNVSFGAAVLDIDAEVKDGKASATNNVGAPVSGGDGGDIADPAVLPNIFVTHEVNDTVDVGIGLHAPYGLKADYDDDFVGRYFADKTELTAIALSPSIAVNNGEGFSMGIGVNIIYAKGRLTKFQDYSNFGLPQEGYFDTEGDDIGATVSFGLLYELTDRTQIGLSGQTGTTLNLEGDATLTNFPQVTSSGVNLVTAKEDANVPLEIPESLTFGIRHRLTDTVTLLAGATWAKWSRFEALDVESGEDGGTISAVGGPKYGDDDLIGHVSENWNDTWQVNVGAIWQATPAWAFKAGYAYDESPVNENYRTARIPSNDRQWLTLGTQWNDAPSGWTVDVAAGVLLFDDVDVNEREYTVDDEPVGNAASYSGTYELSAWSAGVQVSKAF
ncbi:aromatic hydrocarbon degradation protein [Marinobacter halodurans]|uniref:Aromatic hydrocarbon degradation protein n=1 Tax=Marinobacter halodurans TaxID=2528979 RepID=A0ABY1ZJK8_9GAMM|nr:outer membrane protein transport protein [Marinobacter halodurans]TBW52203.1 aromatic hydrocarbon degradation protein [Marinobacter halodurans]